MLILHGQIYIAQIISVFTHINIQFSIRNAPHHMQRLAFPLQHFFHNISEYIPISNFTRIIIENEGLSGGAACRWYISPNIPEATKKIL